MKELTQTDPGVRLIAALLAELSSELPGPLKRLPEVVIRQLAAPVVRDRLGLGDGGLMQAGADYLPGALGAVNFVPGARLAARARASWLRQAANTVCRATTVHFVCSEPGLPEFIIPGSGRMVRQPPDPDWVASASFDDPSATGRCSRRACGESVQIRAQIEAIATIGATERLEPKSFRRRCTRTSTGSVRIGDWFPRTMESSPHAGNFAGRAALVSVSGVPRMGQLAIIVAVTQMVTALTKPSHLTATTRSSRADKH